MLFNSLEFFIFLGGVFALYWALQGRRLVLQNGLLLVASYLFYGWWDWRFLSLIFISSVVDYLVGLGLGGGGGGRWRRALLLTSLAVNLGILGVFKYYNFFVASFAELLGTVGLRPDPWTLQIVIPVGISFYTFQTLSYTIDIYRGRMEPTRDAIAFFAFVAFFPQLVAGPIERAANLLPQFQAPRTLNGESARDGLRQMLWGLLKKVLIADNLGIHVDTIFGSWEELGAPALWVGSFFFAIQIYCDFSGYSDIAIGCARLFGFSLTRNFAFPYFSRDIGEFWRRWHISLSSWFRDYVYIPLGGSRVSVPRRAFNTLVTFGVSGLWHGSNWTFVAWGLLNGLYYLPVMLRPNRGAEREQEERRGWLPEPREALAILFTFCLTLVAWVFFRSKTLGDACGYLVRMFTVAGSSTELARYVLPVGLVLMFLVLEWFQRHKQHTLEISAWPGWARWAVYYLIVALILLKGNLSHVPFIYFQF